MAEGITRNREDGKGRDISLQEFEVEFKKLTNWFNFNKIQLDQTHTIYNRIKRYPLAAFRFAVNSVIDDKKPITANFPTINELTNLCIAWLDSHPGVKIMHVHYNPEDDLRYPIEKLWEGFRILEKQGEVRFVEFADKNFMPRADRARVIEKYKLIKAKGKRTGSGLTPDTINQWQ